MSDHYSMCPNGCGAFLTTDDPDSTEATCSYCMEDVVVFGWAYEEGAGDHIDYMQDPDNIRDEEAYDYEDYGT